MPPNYYPGRARLESHQKTFFNNNLRTLDKYVRHLFVFQMYSFRFYFASEAP